MIQANRIISQIPEILDEKRREKIRMQRMLIECKSALSPVTNAPLIAKIDKLLQEL